MRETMFGFQRATCNTICKQGRMDEEGEEINHFCENKR